MPYIDLNNLRDRTFTYIVGLGNSCSVAYNLRRYFNFDCAFPFDWWITPSKGLISFLNNPDVDFLYNPDLLELTTDKSSVIHKHLGIQLHHEFPREWKLPGAPVRDDWQQHIAHPKERTLALSKRFLNLNTNTTRVLFVRHGDNIDNDIISILNNIFDAIEWTYIRFHDLNIPNVGWKNDPIKWDTALEKLDIKLDRVNHRPFVEKTSEPTYESLVHTDHFISV